MTAAPGQIKNLATQPPQREMISQAEFARRIKCTRQNVGKLVKKGVLVLIDGKLDYAQALAAVDGELDPSHHERLSKKDAEPGTDEQQNTADGYKWAGAKREEHNANLAELKWKEKAGQLIDAEKVRLDAFKIGRTLRDAILSVADRLAPILAAEQNEANVAKILDEELTKALTSVADAGERLAKDVSG